MGLVACALVCGGPASAALNFDQLSACEDLLALGRYLRAGQFDCVAPVRPMEHRLVNAFAGGTICVLAAPPTPSLSDFRCVVVRDPPDAPAILCLKGAAMATIAEYRANYATYAPRVSAYLRAASRCPAGNGDASVGVSSLMPPVLQWIARHQVLFVLPSGGRPVGTTAFVHGYAELDPELGEATDAVEFVSYWEKR